MANYERKRRSNFCDYIVKIFKFVPVIFIFGVIVWSYYAYVIQLSFLYVPNILQKVLYLIFYHLVLIMFMWSYYQTIFTDIGRVPTKFRLPPAELESFCRATSEEEQKRLLENYARDLPITNRTINGAVRFCDKCAIVKPDRAHHCSVCSTCVLKMDHHCPWVNNCVNFTNYKYFILFLGYSLVYCLYVACTTMPFFVQFWRGELDGGPGRFHILFLTLVASMFAVSLVSLFGYHIYLVVLNRTTLEAFRAPVFRFGGPDKNGFSLGSYANFQQVFGEEKLYWFLPVFTSLGDGLQYPVRAPQNYDSMGATQPRLLDNSVAIQIPTERLTGNGHTTFDASNVALTKVEIGNSADNNVIV